MQVAPTWSTTYLSSLVISILYLSDFLKLHGISYFSINNRVVTHNE